MVVVMVIIFVMTDLKVERGGCALDWGAVRQHAFDDKGDCIVALGGEGPIDVEMRASRNAQAIV